MTIEVQYVRVQRRLAAITGRSGRRFSAEDREIKHKTIFKKKLTRIEHRVDDPSNDVNIYNIYAQ